MNMNEIAPLRVWSVAKAIPEIKMLKEIKLCSGIAFERGEQITLFFKNKTGWTQCDYLGENDTAFDVSGNSAYRAFYSFCGREEIEKMKKVLPKIEIWESVEQIHYFDFHYAETFIFDKIYEVDVNSSFAYGSLKLSGQFSLLKKYMLMLFAGKRTAATLRERDFFKKMQNYLIGYFARIKDFVSLRSEIIKNSNMHLYSLISKIKSAGGEVYLSSTDSILTNECGFNAVREFLGDGIGQLKLVNVGEKLYYQSSNIYQIDDKVKYSGVGYFARKHTDFFANKIARQSGSLLAGYDFELLNEGSNSRLCKIGESKIIVDEFNLLGEKLGTKKYTLKGLKNDKRKGNF